MKFLFPALAVLCVGTLAGQCAETTNAAAVPDPVPGYPIGWCIRARPEVFADARWAGFEYVELALQDVLGLTDEEFEKLSAELRRLNLRALSGYNPIPRDLKLVGPDVDNARLDMHVERLLSRAEAMKLSLLILNAGNSWRVPDGYDRAAAFDQLAEFGKRFAAGAAARGMTVLIQPLRGTDSNMITNVAEAVKLVRAVNHPGFQMMVDYSFLTIQKEDPSVLLEAGEHLRQVHLSNPSANRTYPMTDQESDYAGFFKVLKQIGYRGGLSVHGGTQAFTNDAPRAIGFLRKHARELAESKTR